MKTGIELNWTTAERMRAINILIMEGSEEHKVYVQSSLRHLKSLKQYKQFQLQFYINSFCFFIVIFNLKFI